MNKLKIQQLLKKILLEDKPKEYCSNYDDMYDIYIPYKDCYISISHKPIIEYKKVGNWFYKEEVEFNTGKTITNVHIHPYDNSIDNSYFRFEEDEILPYLVKYVERYEERKQNKKDKFLKLLCDEQN